MKKRAVNHSAYDFEKCEYYKIRYEQFVNDTNYPWNPEYSY